MLRYIATTSSGLRPSDSCVWPESRKTRTSGISGLGATGRISAVGSGVLLGGAGVWSGSSPTLSPETSGAASAPPWASPSPPVVPPPVLPPPRAPSVTSSGPTLGSSAT